MQYVRLTVGRYIMNHRSERVGIKLAYLPLKLSPLPPHHFSQIRPWNHGSYSLPQKMIRPAGFYLQSLEAKNLKEIKHVNKNKLPQLKLTSPPWTYLFLVCCAFKDQLIFLFF